MSRRHAAEKREILPDAKFGDRVITKFMNNLMLDGKKSVAGPSASMVRWSGCRPSSSVSRSKPSTRRWTM